MITLPESVVKNLLMIIDVAAKRGAFEGSELSSVGSQRDILTKALEQAQTPSNPVPELESKENIKG